MPSLSPYHTGTFPTHFRPIYMVLFAVKYMTHSPERSIGELGGSLLAGYTEGVGPDVCITLDPSHHTHSASHSTTMRDSYLPVTLGTLSYELNDSPFIFSRTYYAAVDVFLPSLAFKRQI